MGVLGKESTKVPRSIKCGDDGRGGDGTAHIAWSNVQQQNDMIESVCTEKLRGKFGDR